MAEGTESEIEHYVAEQKMGLLFLLVIRNAVKMTVVTESMGPAAHSVILEACFTITITTLGTIIMIMDAVYVLRDTPARVVT